MSISKLPILGLSLVLVFLSSCTYRVVDFTIISSKNVDWTKSSTFVKGRDRIEGQDQIHYILFIPTGIANIKEAMDRAIESTPGCVALLDGVVLNKYWIIPGLYGNQRMVVEGTPLIDPSLSNNLGEIPTYGKIILNRDGEVEEVSSITEMEYNSYKDKLTKQVKEHRFEMHPAKG